MGSDWRDIYAADYVDPAALRRPLTRADIVEQNGRWALRLVWATGAGGFAVGIGAWAIGLSFGVAMLLTVAIVAIGWCVFGWVCYRRVQRAPLDGTPSGPHDDRELRRVAPAAVAAISVLSVLAALGQVGLFHDATWKVGPGAAAALGLVLCGYYWTRMRR